MALQIWNCIYLNLWWYEQQFFLVYLLGTYDMYTKFCLGLEKVFADYCTEVFLESLELYLNP